MTIRICASTSAVLDAISDGAVVDCAQANPLNLYTSD